MKSQTIRIKNLPAYSGLEEKVHVKPISLIIGLLIIGIVVAVTSSNILIGVIIILLALFGLFVMPDKIICEFRDDYLILYNERDKARCNMIYYEDVVSWQYEWYPSIDKLVFNLVDGSTEIQEVYSKYSVKQFLDMHLPHKEIKKKRGKGKDR